MSSSLYNAFWCSKLHNYSVGGKNIQSPLFFFSERMLVQRHTHISPGPSFLGTGLCSTSLTLHTGKNCDSSVVLDCLFFRVQECAFHGSNYFFLTSAHRLLFIPSPWSCLALLYPLFTLKFSVRFLRYWPFRL